MKKLFIVMSIMLFTSIALADVTPLPESVRGGTPGVDNFKWSDYRPMINNNDADLDGRVTTNTAKRTYPQADEDKLATVEDNATADQTGAEIKAAYEAEADTNAYTDSEKTKLAGVEEGANVYNPAAAGDVTADSISVSGVDGSNAIILDDNTAYTPDAGENSLYFEGNVLKKSENGVPSVIGSGGGVAIDDNAGDGDTTVTWSANKSFDELALKINTSAIDGAAESGADKLWSIDQVKAYINETLGFPLVSILAPTAGQWITESPYTGFNGTSSDTGSISAMEWKLEAGGTYAATTGTTTWSVSSVPVTQGENTLYARATDDQSNQTEKTVTFNVDSIAPVVVADVDSTHDGSTPIVGGMTLTEVNPGTMTASVVGATPTTTTLTGTYPDYVTEALTLDGAGDVTVTFDGVYDLAGNSASGTDLEQRFVYQEPPSYDVSWDFETLALNIPNGTSATINGGAELVDGTAYGMTGNAGQTADEYNANFQIPVAVDLTVAGTITLNVYVPTAASGSHIVNIPCSTGFFRFSTGWETGNLFLSYQIGGSANQIYNCAADTLLAVTLTWDGAGNGTITNVTEDKSANIISATLPTGIENYIEVCGSSAGKNANVIVDDFTYSK